jgi:NDP-sugar pyrophosphorylase family protein
MHGSFSAGIIAAGDGKRLKEGYPQVIKPLLPIHGWPLIHWTASGLISAGASHITLLLNSKGREAKKYLQKRKWDAEWDFLEADTASSWESFHLVSKTMGLRSDRFLISTVDALVPHEEIRHFAQTALPALPTESPAAAMALTHFVEDEKPLWADIESQGRIVALGSASRKREFITCGLYALNRLCVDSIVGAQRYNSLREFWSDIVNAGISVMGVPLKKTVDVDRPEDVATAEQFVASWEVPA